QAAAALRPGGRVHQRERLRAVPVPGQRLEHRGEERVRARADDAAARVRGAAGDPLGASRVHWRVTVQPANRGGASAAADPGAAPVDGTAPPPGAPPGAARPGQHGAGQHGAGRPFSGLMRSSLLRLAVRRLLTAIPVVWGVTFLGFTVLNLLPGDAAQALLGAD